VAHVSPEAVVFHCKERELSEARWRIAPEDVTRLAALQQELLQAAMEAVRPGGLVAFCVCTLTAAETTAIDDWAKAQWPDATAEPPPVGLWRPHGRGALLLPQAAGTDGMYLLLLRRT